MTPNFYAFFIGQIKIEICHAVGGWQYKAFNLGKEVARGTGFDDADFAEVVARDTIDDALLYGIKINDND